MEEIEIDRLTLIRRLFSYEFDFDQSKLSGLHFEIPIHENLTDIKPI